MAIRDVRGWIQILLGLITIVVVSLLVVLVVVPPGENLSYTFEPDPLQVTGEVTLEGVPITGQQCFSIPNVYTVTSETWFFVGGPSMRPPGFAPFYANSPTTFEFGDTRPLDVNNCSVFRDLEQALPRELREDLEQNCDAEPMMAFRLNAQAISVRTGTTSSFVIRESEPFTFDNRCDE